MTYIVLVAGQGKNLQPLTLSHPKTLYKLDGKTTVLQRLVRSIRKHDKEAEIVVVVGFMYKHIQKELEDDNVTFVHNPFYSVTSSMGSLWFAKAYLQRENVAIINGDIVMSDHLMNDVICAHTDVPYVLLDSTRTDGNKYNVSKRLSLIKACLIRQFPSMTSTKLYTIRFSNPITTSRLRNPISVSISTTFFPNFAKPVPTFAVVVVFPTPPFWFAIAITLPI